MRRIFIGFPSGPSLVLNPPDRWSPEGLSIEQIAAQLDHVLRWGR